MLGKDTVRWIFGVTLGMAAVTAWSATQPQIDTARNRGLWWLFTHQSGEGAWGSAQNTTVADTAAALDALGVAGVRGPIFSRGYSWLANAEAGSVDSLTRQIATVAGAGGDTARLIAKLSDGRNSQLGWGAYYRYDSSFPDTALAVIALAPVASYTLPDIQAAVCQILAGKRADNGWSYSKASFPNSANSSIVPTVYNILALDAARTQRGMPNDVPCFGSWYTVSTVVDNAVTWLLTQKNADNGFGAGGVSTVIETTFAYQTLAKFRPTDPATGPAFDYLLAQQNPTNGSWNGDAFQTALVMKLLPAPVVPLADTDKDGVPDVVETLMGTNPLVADGRGLASGNGQSVAGLTVPLELAHELVVGQPFTYPLSVSGGTPPYTWKVVVGTLPPGLALGSTTGTISGTPTSLGKYAFTYTVTDTAQVSTQAVGLINVYASLPSMATGDINGDGVVDAADVALVERMVLGLMTPNATQKQRADVSPPGNPDGVIDASDVARIRLKALGID
jgi:hypothetical protein